MNNFCGQKQILSHRMFAYVFHLLYLPFQVFTTSHGLEPEGTTSAHERRGWGLTPGHPLGTSWLHRNKPESNLIKHNAKQNTLLIARIRTTSTRQYSGSAFRCYDMFSLRWLLSLLCWRNFKLLPKFVDKVTMFPRFSCCVLKMRSCVSNPDFSELLWKPRFMGWC